MKLMENSLLQYKGGRVIRVLFINQITSIVYVIDMYSNRWPYPILKDELLKAYGNGEIIEIIDTFNRSIPEEELTEIEREKRDRAWEIITFLKTKLSSDEELFISKFRKKAMDETMANYQISYNGIKNILLKFFKGGCIKNSLIPDYYRCGGKGKERKLSNKKLGRPPKNKDNAGINVDESVKKKFKAGLNKYYYNERNNSLKTTYELILRDYFVEEVIVENGEKIPKISNQIPTYHQFLYWYRRLNDSKKEIIQRQGSRNYQQNFRAIIGNSTGEGWQIDSTQIDVYLVSSSNRNLIVGRPTLYLVVCALTRVIMGFSLSFESLSGYNGELIALYNAMTSKKAFCKKYGIEIEDSEWPYAIPTKILADRGALNSHHIENAIENLGITIQNAPPYRADYKGIVEKAFEQLQLKAKPFVDGVVVNGNKPMERGQQDYRLKATLTIEEFTKIIIKIILFHNNHHVLKDYILDDGMIEENVEKIPIKIWDYKLKSGKGKIRTLPDEVVKMSLLPVADARITARGLLFNKLLYSSPIALTEGLFTKARIKGSQKVKICYNPLDLSEVYLFDESGKLHIFTLLEHLSAYSNKGIDELKILKDYERKTESENMDKELQEKIKLYTDIEEIVNEARVKTMAEIKPYISKKQKLKGIKENQRNERMLQREKLKQEDEELREVSIEDVDTDFDEFDLFRL